MNVIAFPSIPYEFSPLTNKFTGTGGTFDGEEPPGTITFTVLVDPDGGFKTGTIEFRSLDNHLLLHGHVSAPTVQAVEGDHFYLQFPLDVDAEHLPFDTDQGIFSAFVCRPSHDSSCGPNGPDTAAELFTTAYSGASVSLNSYLFLSEVAVPAPDFLLVAGCVLALVVRRWRTR